LLERSAVCREVAQIGGASLRRELVDGRTAQARRPDDEQHLLRGEDDRPQKTNETGSPTRHTVDADPLAGPATGLHRGSGRRPVRRSSVGCQLRAGPHQGDLDRLVTSAALDPRKVGAPADDLAVGAGPVGAAPRQQDDGLDQTRLAGRIRTGNEMRPWSERRVKRGVSPEVADRDRIKHREPAPSVSSRRSPSEAQG
jgi:hypothetical protein